MPPVDESPIVPDAQFEAAMPKIEGDINAPLEAMPSPTGSPTPGPAPATQGQAVQQVREHAEESFAAAPAEDPEFARPLPPLSEFKVEPPVEDKVADKKSLTIRYTTHEEGLSAVGLAGLFEDLSALKNGGGRAANTACCSRAAITTPPRSRPSTRTRRPRARSARRSAQRPGRSIAWAM